MKPKQAKSKKERLSFKRTISNNLFALQCIGKASPFYLTVFLCSAFIYGILEFLENGYLLRKIVNGAENGNIKEVAIFVVVLAIICLVTYTLLNWFF